MELCQGGGSFMFYTGCGSVESGVFHGVLEKLFIDQDQLKSVELVLIRGIVPTTQGAFVARVNDLIHWEEVLAELCTKKEHSPVLSLFYCVFHLISYAY